MLPRIAAFLVAVALVPQAAFGYGSASELLDAMVDAERTRAEGVTDYALDILLMDQPTTQYFERTEVGNAQRPFEVFRLVPITEIKGRLGPEAGGLGIDLDAYVGKKNDMSSGVSSQFSDVDHASVIAERAQIVGKESIDGRDAHIVRADKLNLEQVTDDGTFVIDTITMWVDARNLLMLQMRMDGIIRQKGETRAMFIEKVDGDLRLVPGTGLILPHRSVMRMGGFMGEKEQREMREAQQQLAEFEKQMETMPPDQKAMMQSMMGSRMEMLRNMAETGSFEFETVVQAVRVNTGLADAYAYAPTPTPRSGSGGPMGGMGSLMKQAALGETPEATPAQQDEAALQAAREACLKTKVEQAQARKKKKKRFGKLAGAIGRIAGRHATGGLAGDISRVSRDVYTANATAKDLKEAADALGISPEDVAACENLGREGGDR